MIKVKWFSNNSKLNDSLIETINELSITNIDFVEDFSVRCISVCDLEQLGEIENNIDPTRTIVLIDDFDGKKAKKLVIKGFKVHYTSLPVLSLIELLTGKIESKKYKAHSIENDVSESTNIFVFHAAKGGVGTTTLAVSSALSLARKGKVLYVDLTRGEQLSTYVNKYDSSQGLEPVLSYYSEGKIEKEKMNTLILRNISRTDKFDYLFGPSSSNLVQIEQSFVNLLFSTLRKMEYDYIVVDTNAQSDILNLSLLSISTTNYIVFDSTIQSAWSIMKLYPLLSKLNMISKSFLILNRNKYNAAFSVKDIENQTGLKCVGKIGRVKYVDSGSIFYDKNIAFKMKINKIMGV